MTAFHWVRRLSTGSRTTPAAEAVFGSIVIHRAVEEVVRLHRAPKSHQGYELVVRRHIVPALGRRRLRSLSVSDVRGLVRALEESGMGARGVQQVHAVLRNGLQSAVRDELLGRNVAKLVQIKTPRHEVGRGLSVDQARAPVVGG